MKTIINSILAVDETAALQLEQAKKEKEHIIADARREKKRLQEETSCRIQEHLKKVEESEQEHAKAVIAKIQQETDRQTFMLEQAYESGHLQWEAEILRAILGDAYVG